MTSLRISGNPLFQDSYAPDGKLLTADDGYAITIARLPRLKSLNFSPIMAKDRLNAETYYLSLIAAEVAASPDGQEKAVIRKHERYEDLCKEYGEPVVKRKPTAIDANSLAARLIKLHFHVSDQALKQLVGVEDHFSLELPKSLQVYSVMGYVGKRLGAVAMRIKLIWETDEWDPVNNEDGSDSEEDDGSESQAAKGSSMEMARRDVLIVAGSRSVGTWIEGNEAKIRVELRDTTWHSTLST